LAKPEDGLPGNFTANVVDVPNVTVSALLPEDIFVG
jgi:hypothetical protein